MNTTASQVQKSEAAILAQQNRFGEAFALMSQACNTDPDDAEAWFMLGVLNGKLNYAEPSVDCFRRSVLLCPNNALTHYNLGLALRALDRNAEAVQAFRAVIRLEPRRAEAHANLAVLLINLGEFAAAESCLRTLLTLRPNESEALAHLGRILHARGELGEAIRLFNQVLNLVPDHAGVHDNLATAHSDQGLYAEAITLHRRAMHLIANTEPFVHSNLLLTLQYVPDADPREVFDEHKRWALAHGNRPAGSKRHTNSRERDRRLRVGYVSPDFRAHSVAFFFEPLLRDHNREAMEIYCYSTTPRIDETTTRLRALSPHWRDAARMPDDQLAAQIRADEIDILVDLSGHSGLNRLKMFCDRPAPVQVTWLGYPNTTGLTSIDYRLTDSLADPLGTDEFYTEQLLRLPRCFVCYQALDAAPDIAPAPVLKNGYITFGSFNNLAKINPHVIATWAQLLKAVPTSRLIVKSRPLVDAATRDRLHTLFEQAGVVRNRVELLGQTATQSEHLALYSKLDIALDTFPYNGTTTTCEALWMGVPVVALAGKQHAGRVGLSLLTAAGLTQWIAQTREDYIAVAATFAAKSQYLHRVRTELRKQVSTSALCNHKTFALDVENTYRQIWRQWCGVNP